MYPYTKYPNISPGKFNMKFIWLPCISIMKFIDPLKEAMKQIG